MLKSFNLRRHFPSLPGLLFDIPPAPTDPDKKINIFASGTEVEISRMESKKILLWMSWWTSLHFFSKRKISSSETQSPTSNQEIHSNFQIFFSGASKAEKRFAVGSSSAGRDWWYVELQLFEAYVSMFKALTICSMIFCLFFSFWSDPVQNWSFTASRNWCFSRHVFVIQKISDAFSHRPLRKWNCQWWPFRNLGKRQKRYSVSLWWCHVPRKGKSIKEII